MRRTYKTARISADQIDQAYPLVSRVASTLDLEKWRKACRLILKRGDHRPDLDNIIVTTNPPGYVQGLCIAAVREDEVYGRVLDVPILAVASAADAPGVAADMLGYLKTLGRASACGGIRIWALGPDNWTRHLSDQESQRWDHGALMILGPETPPPADVLWSFHASDLPVKT